MAAPAAAAAPATATQAAAPVAGAASASEARFRNPVQIQIPDTEERSSMLKSFTVYIIHISDFGRSYQVERRFDDFAKLHAELIGVDPNIPPIPEKKMWASTDASTVAERRPAFEKILRFMLRSEEIVMEKSQALWKFLEIPPPGVVAARYMFKTNRVTSARQCGKLLDPKYEKEHAYRLAHESVIKVNLALLTSELSAFEAKADAKAASATSGDGPTDPKSEPKASTSFSDGAAGAEASTSPNAEQASVPPAQEAEAAALEMLRWAISNGGEAARRAFLEERGLAAMLNLLFKKGREGPASDGVPDPRVRTVLNALVKAEGEKYSKVFGEFLAQGGVSLLSGARDVFQKSQGFSEFIAKLLWISWDQETQKAFLHGAHDKEALGLLSALFECPSRTARVCAGLLLSCLLASELLAGKEAQAAAGVYRLVEEMVACSPAWTKEPPKSGGGGGGVAADPAASEGDRAEDNLAAFVQGLGQSEERFARMLSCVDAPWRLNEGNLPDEHSPLWACSAFALWCLLKLRPDPARLAPLRPALPAVTQAAPPRVRWLAAELLLFLQLQCPRNLANDGPATGMNAIVEMTFQESAALEAALREQVEHTRQRLSEDLQHNKEVIQSQRSLTEERQQPLDLLKPKAWHRPLDEVLRRLDSVRGKLTGSLGAAESRSEGALKAVREVMQLELGASESEDRDLELKLTDMREVEGSYLAKKQELAQSQEVLKRQDKDVEEANSAMERADRAVQDTRRQIADLEMQISTKQRDAQSKRTMASSDFSALKGQLMAETESIKQKQAKVRERFLKIQAGEPVPEKGAPLDAVAAQEEMTRLKAEAAQLKARAAELQTEQQRMDVDPATLEQQARASEEAVGRLGQERDALRGALQEREAEHAQAREVWQVAMSNLQAARQARDLAERECSGLRLQLDGIWSAWQPLWARRLQAWRGRMLALAAAQQGGRQLLEAVSQGWDGLRSERALRCEVLQAVQDLQAQLAAVTQKLLAVDDRALDMLDAQ